MPWSKGKSGNSRGRPTKNRVLAQALRETGAHDSFGELSNQQLLARMVWEGLAMGTVTFVGGRTLELDGREWLELVKWVHSHVDGSYRPEEKENDKENEDEEPAYDLPEEQRAFEVQLERLRRIHGEGYARHIAEMQKREIAEHVEVENSASSVGEFALSERF